MFNSIYPWTCHVVANVFSPLSYLAYFVCTLLFLTPILSGQLHSAEHVRVTHQPISLWKAYHINAIAHGKSPHSAQSRGKVENLFSPPTHRIFSWLHSSVTTLPTLYKVVVSYLIVLCLICYWLYYWGIRVAGANPSVPHWSNAWVALAWVGNGGRNGGSLACRYMYTVLRSHTV